MYVCICMYVFSFKLLYLSTLKNELNLSYKHLLKWGPGDRGLRNCEGNKWGGRSRWEKVLLLFNAKGLSLPLACVYSPVKSWHVYILEVLGDSGEDERVCVHESYLDAHFGQWSVFFLYIYTNGFAAKS